MQYIIDRPARDKLAEALRHLVSGQISNDEYEDRIPLRSKDKAVGEIYHEAWYLYSDTHEHRLRGKYRIERDGRREVSRWILFLKTDLPFKWPCWPRIPLTIGNILTFGLLAPLCREWCCQFGDAEVWPFIRRADYERWLSTPPYFAG